MASAGTNNDADTPLSAELVAWADVIFVMEKAHRNKLQQRFRAAIGGKRIVVSISPTSMRLWTSGWWCCSRRDWLGICRLHGELPTIFAGCARSNPLLSAPLYRPGRAPDMMVVRPWRNW